MSPSPERETFHFDLGEGELGVVVSAWMADSGSRDSLGGVEGVGEVSVIGASCVVGFRFQIAMLAMSLRGYSKVVWWIDGGELVECSIETGSSWGVPVDSEFPFSVDYHTGSNDDETQASWSEVVVRRKIRKGHSMFIQTYIRNPSFEAPSLST